MSHTHWAPSECPGLAGARGSAPRQVFQRSGWPGSPQSPGPGSGSEPGLGHVLPGGRPRGERPIPAPAWPVATLPLAPTGGARVPLDSTRLNSVNVPRALLQLLLTRAAQSLSGCHPAPRITSTAPSNTLLSRPVPSQCTPGCGACNDWSGLR